MSRAERLLDLLQLLRRYRYPVSGATLAEELGVSRRTVYRDIAALQAQGARIDGEPGLGYLLRPGFLLPPLMFSDEEIEALALGMRWVADRADSQLGLAARNALAKVAAVLPPDLRERVDAPPLLVGPGTPESQMGGKVELALLRQAIRSERKVLLTYQDTQGTESERTVWPLALAYFDRARVVVAWCELRQGFRHFRADRITALAPAETRYPRRRQALLQEWRDREGIPERT